MVHPSVLLVLWWALNIGACDFEGNANGRIFDRQVEIWHAYCFNQSITLKH